METKKYPSSLKGVTQWAFADRKNLKRLLSRSGDPVKVVNPILVKPLNVKTARELRSILRTAKPAHATTAINAKRILAVMFKMWAGGASRNDLKRIPLTPWKKIPSHR